MRTYYRPQKQRVAVSQALEVERVFTLSSPQSLNVGACRERGAASSVHVSRRLHMSPARALEAAWPIQAHHRIKLDVAREADHAFALGPPECTMALEWDRAFSLEANQMVHSGRTHECGRALDLSPRLPMAIGRAASHGAAFPLQVHQRLHLRGVREAGMALGISAPQDIFCQRAGESDQAFAAPVHQRLLVGRAQERARALSPGISL